MYTLPLTYLRHRLCDIIEVLWQGTVPVPTVICLLSLHGAQVDTGIHLGALNLLIFCAHFRGIKSKKSELEEVSSNASEETKKRKAAIEAKLREEEEQERARQLKRRSSELLSGSTSSKVPNLRPEDFTTTGTSSPSDDNSETFDYGQVDFKSAFSKPDEKAASGDKDFNPNRGKQQEKRRQGGGKPKQRMKGGGGAGLTFNQK